MKATELQTRFLALLDSLRASGEPAAAGRADILLFNFNADLHGKATVAEAVLDTLQVQGTLSEPDPETGCPYGYSPVELPEALVAERDALLAAAAEMQELQAQVEDAERAAGWDPNP